MADFDESVQLDPRLHCVNESVDVPSRYPESCARSQPRDRIEITASWNRSTGG
jgi:hypothetical protein